jgi:HSP20 family protein
MSGDLVPSSIWSFPLMRFSGLADDSSWLRQSSVPSGLSITEDDENVYVDAAMPGISPDAIEMSFHQGVLRISGEMNSDERKGRRMHHSMSAAYSYQVAVPGEIDLNSDPDAYCENGIVTVVFSKVQAVQPRKISVKAKKHAPAHPEGVMTEDSPVTESVVVRGESEKTDVQETTAPSDETHVAASETIDMRVVSPAEDDDGGADNSSEKSARKSSSKKDSKKG